jgi:hypothetical protein
MNTQYNEGMAPSAPAANLTTSGGAKTAGYLDSNHVFGVGARYAF